MGSVCAKRGGIDARRKGTGRGGVAARALAAGLLAAVAGALAAGPARAQGGGALPPTSPTIDCPSPEGQDLIMPPEIVSSGGVLRGTVVLTEENQRLPRSILGQTTRCVPQWVRAFRGKDAAGADLPAPPAAEPVNRRHPDPVPGPTLRAAVGDLVQLALVNQVDSNRFDRNLEIDACLEVGENGGVYPGNPPFDTYPNCLHASSTANIHFHGTHTTPGTTGDNVYLQVGPLPRDNQGNLTTTPDEAMVGFDTFFENCSQRLTGPLVRWPATWADLPAAYTAKQTELLQAYEAARPDQKLWTKDKAMLDAGGWPQYYIGAVPYCFALPAYEYPPKSGSPTMGQAPGTHWYHAHKHGSTAINVANGMTGAFIIEGDYDAYLDANYGSYVLEGDTPWRARSQPVMVLNQLGTVPNLLAATAGGTVNLVVNGRLRPIVHMQPGEVQLWRIVNTAGRSAAYFMPPAGLEWRQLAQDGVQLHNANYLASENENRPFYLAPANRVDLLVKAPLTSRDTLVPLIVQNVTARGDPTPRQETLLTVKVSDDQVTLDGVPAEMPFLVKAAAFPPFLADITDEELSRSNYARKTLVFDSKAPGPPPPAEQHTINGVQFTNGSAEVKVMLASVEEWTVSNTTLGIDHPFHIHINPFQITEVFDPNELLEDPNTGALLSEVNGFKPLRYVTDRGTLDDPANPFRARQCFLDPANKATWSVAGACGPQPKQSNLVWWDTFAIPSARKEGDEVIPGYFKMRSRFVDYPGLYVLHCHILIHEDRGMMFSVEVVGSAPLLVQHH